MKSKYILLTLLFLLTIQIGNAQIIKILTEIDAKKTTYSTVSHNNNKIIVESQSYELKHKIQENIKIIDNINLSYIRNCIDANTLILLSDNNISFSIEYIGKQDGKVISCSLINYGNKVSLPMEQVQCIINQAMIDSFSFTNIPNDVNDFYFKIRKFYKFKN